MMDTEYAGALDESISPNALRKLHEALNRITKANSLLAIRWSAACAFCQSHMKRMESVRTNTVK